MPLHPRLWSACLGLAGLAVSAGGALSQTSVRLDHAAARVLVIPENRGDIAYQVSPGGAGLPGFRVYHDGGVLVLDQGLEGRGPFGFGGGLNCQGSGERARVQIPGKGSVAVRDLPLVTIRTPLAVHVAGGSAVYGEVRPSESLDLGSAGCGDWRVADVRGALRIHMAGSGDVRAASAGDASVDISGSGDLSLAAVRGLGAHIAGSGDVHAARVDGPLSVKIAGSGDVRIDGGRSPQVVADIVGSGDLKFGGEAGSVSAQIAGSGDVDIAHATGPVSKHIAGSGGVNIGR